MCNGTCKNCPNRHVCINCPHRNDPMEPSFDPFESNKEAQSRLVELAKALKDGKALVVVEMSTIDILIPVVSEVDGVKRLHVFDVFVQMFGGVQQALIENIMFEDAEIDKIEILDNVTSVGMADPEGIKITVDSVHKQFHQVIEMQPELIKDPKYDFTQVVEDILKEEVA